MPAGRPSKYPRKRADRDALIERVLELAAEGKSLAQISAEIGIPRTTLLRWGDEKDEFRTTLTRAKELEQAWWENKAQAGILMGKDFNAQVWAKSVQARFKSEYTERREVEHSGGVTYQVVTGVERAPDDPLPDDEGGA